MAAWNWGMKYLGMPGPNPCLVEKFPEERSPRHIPPEADFWKVFQQTQGQDRVLLLAYLHLGARRSELFRLCWEDGDSGNRRIHLGTRKREGGSLEYDWLPMTGELFEALRWWGSIGRSPGIRMFSSASRKAAFARNSMAIRSRRGCTSCGRCANGHGYGFGFHAIRHLTASSLYRLGQPVSVIQAILRHKSPNTTPCI